MIRINGDSPLISSHLILEAIKYRKKFPQYDIITNVYPRTFPKGQSIEIISLSALKNLVKNKISSEEKEHVTLGFYNRKINFKIINFSSIRGDHSQVQLSIDTNKDFFEIEHILKRNKQAINLGWEELVKIKLNDEVNKKVN